MDRGKVVTVNGTEKCRSVCILLDYIQIDTAVYSPLDYIILQSKLYKNGVTVTIAEPTNGHRAVSIVAIDLAKTNWPNNVFYFPRKIDK